MSINFRPDANLTRDVLSAVGYVALMGMLIATTWIALSTISERRATVLSAENLLTQLEGNSLVGTKEARSPLGAASPFLEGPTVTVAGAALLQRVGGAINRIGGNVLSSQVDLQKADSTDGWIGLVVSCEIDERALQKLLYDIEAGTPFLYIDQIVAQAPVIGVEKSRIRLLLTVSGQWWNGK